MKFVDALSGAVGQQAGGGGGGGSPAYFSASSVVESSTNTITITMPTDPGAGGMYVAILAVGDDNEFFSAAPSGWTLMGSVDSNSGRDSGLWVFYRARNGSESGSYAWTADAGTPLDDSVGVIYAYENVSGVVDTSANFARLFMDTADTELAWSGTLATGYADDDILLRVGFAHNNVDLSGVTWSFPAGVATQRLSHSNAETYSWLLVGEEVIAGTPSSGSWDMTAGEVANRLCVAPIVLTA